MPDNQNPATTAPSASKFVGIGESLFSQAAARNFGSYMAGAGTIALTLGVLDAAQVKDFVDAMQMIFDGMKQIFGGVSKVILIAGPVLALIIARVAGVKASLFGRLKAMDADAKQDGIKVVVADNSRAAEFAKQLPGDDVSVAKPLVPVKVTVPPAQPAKT